MILQRHHQWPALLLILVTLLGGITLVRAAPQQAIIMLSGSPTQSYLAAVTRP